MSKRKPRQPKKKYPDAWDHWMHTLPNVAAAPVPLDLDLERDCKPPIPAFFTPWGMEEAIQEANGGAPELLQHILFALVERQISRDAAHALDEWLVAVFLDRIRSPRANVLSPYAIRWIRDLDAELKEEAPGSSALLRREFVHDWFARLGGGTFGAVPSAGTIRQVIERTGAYGPKPCRHCEGTGKRPLKVPHAPWTEPFVRESLDYLGAIVAEAGLQAELEKNPQHRMEVVAEAFRRLGLVGASKEHIDQVLAKIDAKIRKP